VSWKGRDRRTYPRVELAFALSLAIEVGLSGSVTAEGVTINISRGGMLAAIDRSLPLRGRCSVRFLDAGETVKPAQTTGFVRRVTPREDGYLVGIQFDEPLESLDVERTLWAKPRLFDPRGGR